MTLTLGLDPSQVVAIGAIFVLGGLVKGGTGFGLPLTTISLLPLVVPLDMALAMNAMVLIIANAWQFVRADMMRETVARFWPLVGALALGAPVGGALVSLVDRATLTVALGLFVILFVGLNAVNPRIGVGEDHAGPAAIGTGFIAGAAAALTTTPGPILVMFFVSRSLGRRALRSALGLSLCASGLFVAAVYWGIDTLTPDRALLGALCMAPAALGMRYGDRLAARLSPEGFRKLVLALLFGLGVNMVIRALAA